MLCIISTHLEDMKGSGDKAMQDSLLAALRQDYGGDVKTEVGEFVHTGIMHKQDPKTFEVYTDQSHYVKEISEISLTGIDTSDLSAPLTDEMKTLFWSLLGALSWLQQTRADIAPFIGYLQREAHQPTVKLLKDANKVLRYVRRIKSGIVYKKLIPPLKMVTVADSAYKSNSDLTDCTALRGYIILLVGQRPTSSTYVSDLYPGGPCTVMDWVSKKFSVITRSSFCAELRNQLEAAQSSVFLASALEENCHHIRSAHDLRNRTDKGLLSIPIHLCGDNKGVFTAVTAQNPKTPAEPTLTAHVKALREDLDKCRITRFVWVDNRDMIADPLTKGKTKRNELNDVLDKGVWNVRHPTEFWPKTGNQPRPSCSK